MRNHNAVLILPIRNWNLSSENVLESSVHSSYPTYKELKLHHHSPMKSTYVVLILPIRNWNMANISYQIRKLASSYPTYKELKPMRPGHVLTPRSVLILPIRNWNLAANADRQHRRQVLILPIRNWNVKSWPRPRASRPGSYPTYKELKLMYYHVICFINIPFLSYL